MASTYLTRTVGTATNNKKATFSFWIKRGTVTNRQMFVRIIDPSSTASYSYIEFDGTSDTLTYDDYDGSSTRITRTTNQVFRDVSAWYHIVISVDTTQATGSDRAKVYINGSQVTSFAGTSDATQNYVLTGQTSGKTFYIGAAGDVSNLYFDGSMTHFHFIDGTQYAASTFGETDATTGIWKPKTAPSVTYGTNGFFLKFENSGSMGTDSSGNANNFTVNGTCTQNIDTPSNVFSTLDPLHRGTELGNATFSNGNLKHQGTTSGGNYPYTFSTLAASKGKWYAEFKVGSDVSTSMIGIASGIADSFLGGTASAKGYALYGSGQLFTAGSGSSYGTALNNGDIRGVAMDLDNNKLYFSINGTWENSGDPTSGATGTGAVSITAPADNGTGFYHFACGKSGSATTSIEANFGNGYFGTTAVASAQNPDDGIGIFEYDVPAGYRALCTKSINAQEYS